MTLQLGVINEHWGNLTNDLNYTLLQGLVDVLSWIPTVVFKCLQLSMEKREIFVT